jgi:hypothetical protein
LVKRGKTFAAAIYPVGRACSSLAFTAGVERGKYMATVGIKKQKPLLP